MIYKYYMAQSKRRPLAVDRTMKKLGRDLRTMRLRRHLTMELIAERARTSRPTLQRVENGDPTVGMGIYASVMQALGVLPRLAQLADPMTDEVGLSLAEAEVPQRARTTRRRTGEVPADE